MDMAGTAVAVDIGGTFTDLAVRYPDGSTGTAKALTTPGALADGVVDALRLSGADGAEITFFVHGTTAGLNALLERKYAHRRPDHDRGLPRRVRDRPGQPAGNV